MAGPAAFERPGEDGRTGIGLFLGNGLFLFLLLPRRGIIFGIILPVLPAFQFLRQPFRIAVELFRVRIAVVLELAGGAVDGDVADLGTPLEHRGGRQHLLQFLRCADLQFFLFLKTFLLLLLRKIKHEGVLLLDLEPDLDGQQNDNHREMDDRGDVQACLLVGRELHFFLPILDIAFSTVAEMTSMATLLWPPCGTMISAKRLEGSMNCRCIGLTVSQ